MRRVLIIDDMLPNVLLLKGLVKRLDDVEVLTFTDPLAALAKCREVEPDLVLLDYHMPQMSGLDFLKAFRGIERLKDVPVVMITGEEKRETLYEALGMGANDFLRKPVDEIELSTRARNLLELRARQVELARVNEQLFFLATTDQLTNLRNRRFFLEKLESEIARSLRYNRPCSVAVIDADRFKSINDTYGHPVGDMVLKALADALSDDLRNVDLVGRLGGEEFGIQFPETDIGNAQLVCNRLLSRVREIRVPTDNATISFTISAGVTEIRPSGDEPTAILKRADTALYKAKESGRDRCEVA